MRAVWKDPIRTGDVCLLLTVFQIAGYLMMWETKTPFQRTGGVCLIAVLLLLFGASCLAARQCRRWKGLVAAGCAGVLVLLLIFDVRALKVEELPGWDPEAGLSGVALWVEGEDGFTDLRWFPDGGEWQVETVENSVTVRGGDGAELLEKLGDVELRNYWWFDGMPAEDITTLHVTFSDGRDVDFYLGRDSWSVSGPDGDWLPGKWYVDRPFSDLLEGPLREAVDGTGT